MIPIMPSVRTAASRELHVTPKIEAMTSRQGSAEAGRHERNGERQSRVVTNQEDRFRFEVDRNLVPANEFRNDTLCAEKKHTKDESRHQQATQQRTGDDFVDAGNAFLCNLG